MAQWIHDLITTDMTQTIHRDTYPAISSSRPELNQKGRTVLVTGGGTGIGLAISRSFIQASADIVIVIGRRSDILAAAKFALEEKAKTVGTNTKIITYACDVTNMIEVNALWKTLEAQGITVDVYVSNAAKFSEPKPIFELGADEVWSQVEVNAKGPLYFAEKFYCQQSNKQKVCHLFLKAAVVPYLSNSLAQSNKLHPTVHCQCLNPRSLDDRQSRSKGAPCLHTFKGNWSTHVPSHCPEHLSKDPSDYQLPSRLCLHRAVEDNGCITRNFRHR